jgi:hypothetical protein
MRQRGDGRSDDDYKCAEQDAADEQPDEPPAAHGRHTSQFLDFGHPAKEHLKHYRLRSTEISILTARRGPQPFSNQVNSLVSSVSRQHAIGIDKPDKRHPQNQDDQCFADDHRITPEFAHRRRVSCKRVTRSTPLGTGFGTMKQSASP